jgi:colanic acid biosynthesis glycosyl transferase WcaI
VNLVFVTPHFAPDVAPTGAVVTRIVEELGRSKHTIRVITSLPWYRRHQIEPGYEGRLVRYEDTPWGGITRIHPFPAADKRDLIRRGAAFAGFSLLAGLLGARGEKIDGVLALSPPLTLGLAGWIIARRRDGPFVFNVQDVYPDIAVTLGALTNRKVIATAQRLERFCYARADAVTVLSNDQKDNVGAKVSQPQKVRVIPNFVDTERIRPQERENSYRREFGLQGKTVVMYAGNVGLSQALDTVIEAAAALVDEDNVVFVINGQGAARRDLERSAGSLSNVRFVDAQPSERLSAVLAAADIHLVTLKKGLSKLSVPSKSYSILAAGRPLIASVDPGSEIARIIQQSGGGIAVPPQDAKGLAGAIRRLAPAPEMAAAMGRAGRTFVERWASPTAVARAYEQLFAELRSG